MGNKFHSFVLYCDFLETNKYRNKPFLWHSVEHSFYFFLLYHWSILWNTYIRIWRIFLVTRHNLKAWGWSDKYFEHSIDIRSCIRFLACRLFKIKTVITLFKETWKLKEAVYCYSLYYDKYLKLSLLWSGLGGMDSMVVGLDHAHGSLWLLAHISASQKTQKGEWGYSASFLFVPFFIHSEAWAMW